MDNKPKTYSWWQEVISFDLRSLALFRIGLALIVIGDLIFRSFSLAAHYTDNGVLPREALVADRIGKSFYWSLNNLSGSTFFQVILFLLAGLIALALLVGYRTRLATIATWVMVISIHNRNPTLIFAADDVLRALLFWSMFLPLGATYSIDSALNKSDNPFPKRIFGIPTLALMIQQILIYAGSAAFKTKSEIWWPSGDAVYYALNFDQYVTTIGQILLSLDFLLRPLTIVTLWFEWFGPLMIFIPWKVTFWRYLALASFVPLHIGFGLHFHIGIFPFLSVFSWLAYIPSHFWDGMKQKISTPEREGLRINYDKDCGFCKKVVYLLRTFLILPGTPLLVAQENESIYAAMLEQNSWVVEDYKGNRIFKWQAVTYVVSLSPVFFPLAYIMRWQPLMSLGTKFYEFIASNRKFAGIFTTPFKFRNLDVKGNYSWFVSIVALLFLLLTLVSNVRSFVAQTVGFGYPQEENQLAYSLDTFLKRRTFQRLFTVSRLTRLDQSWSIFAPTPPLDDGWHVIVGKLADGSEVDLLHGGKVIFDKPSLKRRNQLYPNMQWRTFFINLNRNIGNRLYPHYVSYLCRQWNSQHSPSQRLVSLEVFFMDERTVSPNEVQSVEKTVDFQASCDSIDDI